MAAERARRKVLSEAQLELELELGLTGHVFDLDVRSVELGLECCGDGIGCDAGGVCFCGGLGVGGCGHGETKAGWGVESRCRCDDSGCLWRVDGSAEDGSSCEHWRAGRGVNERNVRVVRGAKGVCEL